MKHWLLDARRTTPATLLNAGADEELSSGAVWLVSRHHPWIRAVGDFLARPQGNEYRLAEMRTVDYLRVRVVTVSRRLKLEAQANVLLQDLTPFVVQMSEPLVLTVLSVVEASDEIMVGTTAKF